MSDANLYDECRCCHSRLAVEFEQVGPPGAQLGTGLEPVDAEHLNRVIFDLRLALENIWKWSEEDSVPPGKYFEEEARKMAQWALDHAGEVSDEEPSEAVEF